MAETDRSDTESHHDEDLSNNNEPEKKGLDWQEHHHNVIRERNKKGVMMKTFIHTIEE